MNLVTVSAPLKVAARGGTAARVTLLGHHNDVKKGLRRGLLMHAD